MKKGDSSNVPEEQSRRPRILVLTELFLPTKGGTAVWFDEVYRRLGDAGTHVVTAQVPGSAAHDRGHPNTIHRLRLQHSRWLRPASLPMYVKFFVQALWLTSRHPFDAIHAGRVLPEGYVGLAAARLTRLPLVVYAHGEEITTWRSSPRRLKAMKRVYQGADRVIANSQFTRDQLLDLGTAAENIRIIYPGVDVSRFRPDLEAGDLLDRIGLTKDQSLVLSVGRLSRRKGFDQIVKTLPGLVAQGIDVHYALIGIGEDKEYLESLAREERVMNRVHFLGHVPSEDLPRWYNAADVFAMPNREINGDTEGFGMVFMEAAACARPAIAGQAGGTGDAVIDAQTGFRVDGESLEAVGDALSRVLRNKGLAHTLGLAGYERVRTEFSWERVTEKIETVCPHDKGGSFCGSQKHR